MKIKNQLITETQFNLKRFGGSVSAVLNKLNLQRAKNEGTRKV